MQRAKMCELLASAAKCESAETYFTVGLFSMLEVLMDAPLEKILDALPFTEDIRRALLAQEGPYGDALKCVIAYEQGEFGNARFRNLAPSQMTDTYIEAAKWADQSARALSD